MAYEIATSSGLLSSSSAVSANPAELHSFMVTAPTAGSGSITIYDNPSAASGTVLAVMTVEAGSPGACCSFDHPIAANTGIYAAIAGTGVTAVVTYSRQ